MAMGGIPHYLQNINHGEHAAQIIDRLCFAKDGRLKNEFNNLYKSLFAHSQNHERVIRALATQGKGLTRNEIIHESGFRSGGTTTRILHELKESSFIAPNIPFQKNANESINELSDDYSMFYLKFIEQTKNTTNGAWFQKYRTPA